MVVIPGWQCSQGTKDEIETARQAGIPVYFWLNEKDREFLQHYYADWSNI